MLHVKDEKSLDRADRLADQLVEIADLTGRKEVSVELQWVWELFDPDEWQTVGVIGRVDFMLRIQRAMSRRDGA